LFFHSKHKNMSNVKKWSCSHLRHQGAWYSGGIIPLILTVELHGGECSPSRPGHLTPKKKSPPLYWYPLHMKLTRQQMQSRRFGKEKNLLPCQD
jgi:hypothetical protein